MQPTPREAAGSVRVSVPASIVTPAVIRIHCAGQTPDLFFVGEMSCDVPDARQFELIGYRPQDAGHEAAVRRYALLVKQATVGGIPDGQCDCADGTYRGNKRPCKHVRAVHALWMKGEL